MTSPQRDAAMEELVEVLDSAADVSAFLTRCAIEAFMSMVAIFREERLQHLPDALHQAFQANPQAAWAVMEDAWQRSFLV